MKQWRIIFPLLALSWGATASGITLDALLQRTIEKNPEIQKSRHDLEQACGHRLVFRSVGLPDATIGITGGVQGGHRAEEKSIQPFGFAYGNFSQSIFNAIVPPSFRRGDVELLIAQQRLNVAVVEQLHAARLAFYTAIYNRSLERVRAEQHQRLEQDVSSQKDRYQAGVASRGVFVAAEVQMRELDTRIEVAHRAYGGAQLKMAEAMGQNLAAGAKLPEPEGELNFGSIDVDLDPEITAALARRPDLELARLMVRAADEDQRIIEAAYYPAITAVVSGDYIPVSGVRRENQASPRRSDNVISSEIRGGVAYTWRVVDNGKTSGAVLKQRSAREINELLLQKLEADVPREMSRIHHDLEAITTKHRQLAGASSAAEENAATLQQNLAQGIVSQFEFRLAENDLLEIKSGLVSLAYQQKLALAEWDRATGRYFQFSHDSSQNVR
ncbi:MAG TPA: TolC family protein [Chthoniobacterales bacterium]|jgi:outer membrane protein TolC